jgi:hypothetical protein
MLQLTTPTSSTSKPAPMSWVEKLFQRMGATFGSRFTDMWRNENVDTLKEVWAMELGKLSTEEVRLGVENLTRLTKAPTLPEFVLHCKACRREQIDNTAPRLEDARRADMETIDANLPRMRSAVKQATKCSPSATWAYELLQRGTARNGSALTVEVRKSAVDTVLSWAGQRVLDEMRDAELRGKYQKIRNECFLDRKGQTA